MHTSLLLIALLGPAAAPDAVGSDAPRWQESYRAARDAGRKAEKPLAVFVGQGTKGWEQATEEGKWTRRTRQLLAEHYVCVYVDATSPTGQGLARALEIGSGNGLVLSTRNGEDQAFAHDGKLTRGELEETLQKYASASSIRQTEQLARARYTALTYPDSTMRPVASATPTASTSSVGTVPQATYQPAYQPTYQPAYQPTYQPAYQPTYQPSYAPAASYGSFGGFSGGGRGGAGC
ncbi:MAG: PT domain-containing protein [Gemmataceae bacterium]